MKSKLPPPTLPLLLGPPTRPGLRLPISVQRQPFCLGAFAPAACYHRKLPPTSCSVQGWYLGASPIVSPSPPSRGPPLQGTPWKAGPLSQHAASFHASPTTADRFYRDLCLREYCPCPETTGKGRPVLITIISPHPAQRGVETNECSKRSGPSASLLAAELHCFCLQRTSGSLLCLSRPLLLPFSRPVQRQAFDFCLIIRSAEPNATSWHF